MFWSISPLSWSWRRANTWNVSFETPNSGQFTLSTQLIIQNKQINVSIKIFVSLVSWSYLYLPKFQGNNPLLMMYWKVPSKCEWYIHIRCQFIFHLFDPPFLKIKIPFHNSNLSYHIVGIWPYSAAPNPTLLFSHRCQSHSFFCVKSALKKQKVNHIIRDLLKYSTKYFAHAQNIFTWYCTSHIGVSKEWKTLISIS